MTTPIKLSHDLDAKQLTCRASCRLGVRVNHRQFLLPDIIYRAVHTP
jgi:hypothetical protein